MTMKTLAIVALLLGGTSLAMAQNGPPTGGQLPAATPSPPPPGVIPHDAPRPQATAPSPNMQSAAPQTGAVSGIRMAQKTIKPTKHRNNLYMSAKGSTHKSKKTSTKGGY
jgi:hypothetical protein